MVYFTDNKKLNIKINILLAAFLEDEFHNIEVCLDEINKSLKENIGIWTYVYKTDDGYYHPAIAVGFNDEPTVNFNGESAVIFLDKSNFTDKVICFKTGLKVILAYICCLAKDDKNSAYNIVEHDSCYMCAINEIIDTCENFGIDLRANYNKYHATIDCYFPDLIESILI